MIDLLPIVHAAEEASAESESVVGLLGINWMVFIGQLVNFTVILFILWKWVFKPVTNTMQKRTKEIEKSLADADDVKKRIAELEVYTKEQKDEAAKEYAAILAKAQDISEKQKEEILAEARAQAARLLKDAEERIAAEKTTTIQEAKEELADIVAQAVERILAEKMTSERDQRYIKETLQAIKRKPA